MMIELATLIRPEDSSHQGTDVKRNNPFDLEFGPGLKCRDQGQVFGFQGVLGFVMVHPQNPSTNAYHGLTPLGLLLQDQGCSSQVASPTNLAASNSKPENHKHCLFAPEPRLFLKVDIAGQGLLLKISKCFTLGLVYSEVYWLAMDPG